MKCGYNELTLVPRSRFSSEIFELQSRKRDHSQTGDLYDAKGDKQMKFPMEQWIPVTMGDFLSEDHIPSRISLIYKPKTMRLF